MRVHLVRVGTSPSCSYFCLLLSCHCPQGRVDTTGGIYPPIPIPLTHRLPLSQRKETGRASGLKISQSHCPACLLFSLWASLQLLENNLGAGK